MTQRMQEAKPVSQRDSTNKIRRLGGMPEREKAMVAKLQVH